MAYRNELDAAHAQIEVLRVKNRTLNKENQVLRNPAKPKKRKRSSKKPKAVRSGFRYERPETLWPLFEDWGEMVSFFSSVDSDSVLSWVGGKIGFLAAVLFFTPIQAVISVLILPFVVLSGFKIGR